MKASDFASVMTDVETGAEADLYGWNLDVPDSSEVFDPSVFDDDVRFAQFMRGHDDSVQETSVERRPSESEGFIQPDTQPHSSVIVPPNRKGTPWRYRRYYDKDRGGNYMCRLCPKYETRQYKAIIDHIKKDPHWIDSGRQADCPFPGCNLTRPDLGTLLDHVERNHRSSSAERTLNG